jgi:sarcosine oxidase subunit beta
MTPDGLPLVGPTVADGLWLCCGWSGTGFKTGPAVGEALAGWLASGVMDPDLAGFGPDRDMVTPAGVRSPH